MYNDIHFNRPQWKSLRKTWRLNEQTRDWFERIYKYIDFEGYVLSSCGMLMGMLNATSTFLRVGAVMHRIDPMCAKVVTLRSSDDSMTVYIAKDR